MAIWRSSPLESFLRLGLNLLIWIFKSSVLHYFTWFVVPTVGFFHFSLMSVKLISIIVFVSLFLLFWLVNFRLEKTLILSWRMPLSYKNQPIGFLCKSMNWFLYDKDLRHETVKEIVVNVKIKRFTSRQNGNWKSSLWKILKLHSLLLTEFQLRIISFWYD